MNSLDLECSIEVMEQPAEKVKFRMEVHTHKCQPAELLLGRTVMPNDSVTFPKVRVVPRPGSGLRQGTKVRMSLVDVRSSPDRIIDHWHRLVDCKTKHLAPSWSVIKEVEPGYGWVTFGNLGVVKSLERERAQEVGERAVIRQEECGNLVRSNKHKELEVRDRAEERCRETCAFRLKLCFEAYITGEGGLIHRVADPVFSDIILDETRPDKTGDLPIQKISICSDTVEGGQEVMVFTGNETTKINLKRSNFYVEFFELDEQQQRKWKSGRIPIPRADLHGLGQILGGLSFKVPVFDKDHPGSGRPTQIDTDTTNVFLEIIKTNKAGKEEAKSDQLYFTYKPSRMSLSRIKMKRPMEAQETFQYINSSKVPKPDPVPQFISRFPNSFNPILSSDTPGVSQVTIMNIPITSNQLPATVETINQQNVQVQLPSESPMSPCSALSNMAIGSPQPTQSSQPQVSHPQVSQPQVSHQSSLAVPTQTQSPHPQHFYSTPNINPPSDQHVEGAAFHFPQQAQAVNDTDNFDELINNLLTSDSPINTFQNNQIDMRNVFFDGRLAAGVCSDSCKKDTSVKKEELVGLDLSVNTKEE